MMMELGFLLAVVVPTLASLNVTIDNLSPRELETVTITCTIPGFGTSTSFASFTVANRTWGTCSQIDGCDSAISANFSTNPTSMIMRKKIESTDGGLMLTCAHDGDTGDLIIPHVASTTTTTATSPSPPFHYQGILGILVVVFVIPVMKLMV